VGGVAEAATVDAEFSAVRLLVRATLATLGLAASIGSAGCCSHQACHLPPPHVSDAEIGTWVHVAVITGSSGEELTSLSDEVEALLTRVGIPCAMDGSLAYTLFVPPCDALRARAILAQHPASRDRLLLSPTPRSGEPARASGSSAR
jgi:hypothetical protein